MKTILCTLYNSLYLDKGLVLYDSLCESAKDFKLYVLCMDDKCYDVLEEIKKDNHIPIRLSDFEEGDTELLKAKGNRSVGEYCWTCSSSFIRYILKHYKEPVCTYIDADMYFYSDPQLLVDEMLSAGKSVLITPHRFPKNKEHLADIVGKYCVEFNTFCNTPESLEVLEYWRNRCLECCSNLGDGVHWGDQKYLEELVQKFDCVNVCENKGAGVAPWNIIMYDMNDLPFIFYHFQSVKYVTRNIINTGVLTYPGIKLDLVYHIYYKYLNDIERKKSYLELQYGISTFLKSHPAEVETSLKNKFFVKLNQTYFYLKIKSLYKKVHPYIIVLKKSN